MPATKTVALPPAAPAQRAELLCGRWLFLWVLALLILDLETLRWFPVPWFDEVEFTDPAANMVLNGQWASSLWFARGDFTHWGGNVPAYDFLLTPWLWLWGFSESAVRSLNCVLVAFTIICTWFAVKRLNLIPSPTIRLASLMALSLCYPVSYCVRCGRPDVVGMLIFAGSALVWSSPRKLPTLSGLFGCALCIPFAGLQYAFYLPLLLGCIFWIAGKPVLPRLYAIIAGGLLGALLLGAYYQFVVGWDGLLASMTDVHNRRPHGLLANLESLCMGQLFPYYLTRPHFVLLIIAGVLLGMRWRHLTKASRKLFGPAIVLLLLSGVTIGLGAHFMAPYHWMAVVPAAILLAGVTAQSWKIFNRKLKFGLIILTAGLAVSGRIVFLGMGAVKGGDEYTSAIERWSQTLVPLGANVYVDPQIYYALKPRAGRIYLHTIAPVLTREEKNEVSRAFVMADERGRGLCWLTNNFPGTWIHLADFPLQNDKKQSGVASRLLGFFHAGYYIGYPLSAYSRGTVGVDQRPPD